MTWKQFKSNGPVQLDLGILCMRVFVFACMLTHGWPKFQKLVVGNFSFADPMGLGEGFSLFLAVVAEFFGAIAIILGVYFRPALILNIITMGVAAFVVHGPDAFGKKELALIYLAVSIGLYFTGAGKYSIQKK